jgi:hypothetical protein
MILILVILPLISIAWLYLNNEIMEGTKEVSGKAKAGERASGGESRREWERESRGGQAAEAKNNER